ncbi:D-amino-acid transaminase [Hypericibacter terrae]|jgi:D-alanine transaminase|uniref:D-alanine aminotransferase n=1 Tax=Hypericibacter terrae TaxID=2602015 RepID=A0A5J6MID6_9PROT|nr:D-amino-acid transaminase [Hypericibacter terrae]QEX17214.1 D-amino-acid transaminase [Hypericibacter terrae]
MSRIAYVNGRYLPLSQAQVHIEDRGYQFADGVYEVVPLYRGRLLDEDPHLDRFDYSLRELQIAPPMSRAALKLVLRELVRRNGLSDALLYFQATRGVAPRDHKFPAKTKTAFVATMRRSRPPSAKQIEEGVSVMTTRDIRWERCDIKSLNLLPNLLAKQQATVAGVFEAWLVDDDDNITEGSSTNAWIVTSDGKLVTHDAGAAILNGITRQRVIKLMEGEGLTFEQRAFSREEAMRAREAFLSSSSSFVLPITRIDGKPVGEGKPGPMTRRLREIYVAAALEAPVVI